MTYSLTFKIRKTGMLTTVQDLGRQGWQEYGVPPGGAMDKKSLRLANRLVGNSEDSPCLEITIIGPEIQFQGTGMISLAGADLSARMNGKPIPPNQPLIVSENDLLTFGKCKWGCRSYLGIHGEWMIPAWLGSRSEVPYAGSQEGLPPVLKRDDEIEIRYDRLPEREMKAEDCRDSRDRIRIVPGPEFSLFTGESKGALVSHPYTISRHSNRMGYRMEEKLIGEMPEREMISSGVVPGTIQVTSSGQIILMMADAQTTGGYHRIAAVVQPDLDILGQKKPGDKINFQLVDIP